MAIVFLLYHCISGYKDLLSVYVATAGSFETVNLFNFVETKCLLNLIAESSEGKYSER